MSFSRAPNKANAVLNSLPNEKDKPESTSFNLTKCEESLKLAYVPYNFYAIQIYLVENVCHKFWRYHSPKKYLAGQKKRKIRGLNRQFCGAVSYIIWYILYCPGNFIKEKNLDHILTERAKSITHWYPRQF